MRELTHVDQLAMKAAILGAMLHGSPQWFAAAVAARIARTMEEAKRSATPKEA